MKKLIRILWILGLLPVAAAAWNPITDVRDNVQWTFGKTAEVGTAIKLAGGTDMEVGTTATSMLAGIFDYRWISFSYGGTRVNKNAENFTDTAKVGLQLTKFFDWFKNPTTPEMAFMRNLNIGPSFSMPIWDTPRVGTVFLDVNYRFGPSGPVAPATPAP